MEKVTKGNPNIYAAIIRKALLDYKEMKDKEERFREVLMDLLELNLNRKSVLLNQND